MSQTIVQKSLFGKKDLVLGGKKQAEKPKNFVAQPKSQLPKLLLKDGFDASQLQAEAVFWHRILANQYSTSLASSQNQRKFIRILASEIKLKNGKQTPEILMRDLLLMKNLG